MMNLQIGVKSPDLAYEFSFDGVFIRDSRVRSTGRGVEGYMPNLNF